MAEVSTAAAPEPEGVLHRRIEFHLARRPHTALAMGGGGFRMETLNPDASRESGAGVQFSTRLDIGVRRKRVSTRKVPLPGAPTVGVSNRRLVNLYLRVGLRWVSQEGTKRQGFILVREGAPYVQCRTGGRVLATECS